MLRGETADEASTEPREGNPVALFPRVTVQASRLTGRPMVGKTSLMSEMTLTLCPVCQIGVLKHWRELTEEEKMIALARPSPDDNRPDHRIRCHVWCMRCGAEIDLSSLRLDA
jgi:hypothetical protein